MTDARMWHDLGPRVLSGAALAAGGVALLWAGGWIFILAACALCGVMVWEAARLFAVPGAERDGALAAAALMLALVLPGLFVLPLVLAAGLVTAGRAPRDRGLCLGFTVWLILATLALVVLREAGGAVLAFWLVAVVVASDVAGYFAGRRLGGPKFWPRISPKKTWSGTVSGWLAAAVAGAVFAGPTGAGAILVPLSVVVALAGQIGDIAESVVKRRAGVKDSSALIPGHGGLLDRFDALLGAAAVAALLWASGAMPQTT